VIIAGDFNADPQEEAIITMKNSFSSAYEKLLGSEPVFTTYKYRKPTELQARTIDYVFFNKKVESVCGWLDIPEEKTIPVIGNPNENHPSDHYAIAFEFKITSS
jgi:endonuclease/exonuclease/phosphatase family metal-dependent hydrolase